MERLYERFDRLDAHITHFLASYGITILRVSLGIVFLWFGALKFFPGLSPAQDLATRTIDVLSFGLVPASLSIPVLAAWECLVGLGLISGLFLRTTLLLLVLQMVGTVMPVFLFPADIFVRFPYALTLEGQYIVKNVVLVGAALVVGATVRGGCMIPEPPDTGRSDVYARSSAPLRHPGTGQAGR